MALQDSKTRCVSERSTDIISMIVESLNSEFGGRGGAMKYVASIRGG
jgi:hypothetical protein